MKILMVGDIVGENGLDKLKQILPKLKMERNIDFIVVNGENAAGGMGLTFKIWDELLKLPIDCVTMGNHTWAKKDIFTFIDHPKLIRPANYSKGVVGKGYGIYDCQDKKVAVINLIGRTDMNVLSENPFTVADELIEKINATSLEENNLYKIIFIGKRKFEINILELYKLINQKNIIKIKDKSRPDFNLKDMVNPNTLKGIFIGEILKEMELQNYTQEEIDKIIEIGLSVLEK